jgi:hypothetical protein
MVEKDVEAQIKKAAVKGKADLEARRQGTAESVLSRIEAANREPKRLSPIESHPWLAFTPHASCNCHKRKNGKGEGE